MHGRRPGVLRRLVTSDLLETGLRCSPDQGGVREAGLISCRLISSQQVPLLTALYLTGLQSEMFVVHPDRESCGLVPGDDGGQEKISLQRRKHAQDLLFLLKCK